MLYYGAKAGAFDLDTMLMETATCMRRAGADVIVTYFAPKILEILSKVWLNSHSNEGKFSYVSCKSGA